MNEDTGLKETPKEEFKTPDVTVSSDGLEKKSEKYGDYTAEIIRDFYGRIDPFYLSKKDPKYAYRFLRFDPKNLTMKTSNLLLQKGGWQLCPKEHLLRIGIKERELGPDDFYHVGDQVLAFMPKELFDEKEQYKLEQAQAPMKTINRLLEDGDSSVGGRDMHETMKGIQPKERLKGKW